MEIPITDRILVTDFRRSDVESLVKWLAEPEIYERTLRIPSPYTTADANNWIEIVESEEGRRNMFLAGAIRDEHGQLIGGVGLERRPDLPDRGAELGYWLAKPYWGRGIMTDVVRAVCGHAFAALGIEQISANVFSFNEPSARVLEKSGFQYAAFIKDHTCKNGRMIDARRYVLAARSDEDRNRR